MTTDPVLITINQVATMIGQHRRTIYSLIAGGRLKAVKSGRSTLVFYDSVKQYIAGLPPAHIKLDTRAKRHLEAVAAA
jgi:excisionase family DNA binding protein